MRPANDYARAVAAGITVFASAGDDGTSNPEIDGTTFYPYPTVGFPSSSPLVTSVGGTDLTLTAAGTYVSGRVWNDAQCCAGGGGISQIFHEPAYQSATLPRKVQRQLGGMRGLPDISYNAAVVDEFIQIYESFPGSGGAGWYGVGGTSEGAPQWAGIVADLNSYVGVPLGFPNPSLYVLGGLGLFGELGRDITLGNNALTDVQVPPHPAMTRPPAGISQAAGARRTSSGAPRLPVLRGRHCRSDRRTQRSPTHSHPR